MALLTSQNAFLDIEKNQLESIITLAGTAETPFTTLLMGRGLVSQMASEKVVWREEYLPEPGAVQGKKEGAEFEESELSTRKTRSNTAMIFSRGCKISATAEAIANNGGAEGLNDLLAREMEKQSILIKKALERALIQATEKDEDSTGRCMNGLTNLTIEEQVIDAKNQKVSKKLIRSMMKKQWEKGVRGEKFLLVSPTVKAEIDDLYESNANNLYNVPLQVGANAFGITVSQIHTSFGVANVLISTDVPERNILLVDINYCELKRLRAFDAKDVPQSTDGTFKVIVGEYSLAVRNSHAITKAINVLEEDLED